MTKPEQEPREQCGEQAWPDCTAEEKRQLLFRRQKELLDTFLAHNTITRAQYDKSLGDLRRKMNIPRS